MVVETFRDLGVTHVLGIPDNESAPLFDRLARNGEPELLTVTREGEAFAIAAGLWVGGARPVVSIQGTGLLESGDAIRGTVVRMGVPLVCLVGYRGYTKMRRAGIRSTPGPATPHMLRRADVDSAALYLEPTLRAWGVPFEELTQADPAGRIRACWNRAHQAEHPAALLLTAALE